MKINWKKLNILGKECFVSDTGIIKINNKIMKTHYSTNGYLYISICDSNKVKHFKVHRLVAQAFIPNPENKPQVNHIDGNKLNNCVNNLEWCNNSQNIKHAYDTGIMEKRKIKKIKINQFDTNGNFIKTWNSFTEIEKKLKVSRSTIRFCCLNKLKTCKGYIWRYAD